MSTLAQYDDRVVVLDLLREYARALRKDGVGADTKEILVCCPPEWQGCLAIGMVTAKVCLVCKIKSSQGNSSPVA
jgi:hypothetical protein